MVRRVLPCLLLVAASMASAGEAHALENGLKPGLTGEQDATQTDEQANQEIVIVPRVTSLTVNPLPEPPPLAKKRRPEDDPYAALGIDLGAFYAYPTLKAGAVYTDNVAQSHDNRQSDIGLRLRPSLRVESDWVRHSFNLNAGGDFAYYKNQSVYDAKEANATARLRLDVQRTTDVTFCRRTVPAHRMCRAMRSAIAPITPTRLRRH
jgi:hypothetical protein